MKAITYANEQPAASLHARLAHVRANAADLGVDPERLGVLACSGNAALGLSLAFRDAPVRIRGAALLYPMTLPRSSSASRIPAPGAASMRSRPTCRSSSRAGRDATPGLNASLDRFDDGEAARLAIEQTLAFLRARLRTEAP